MTPVFLSDSVWLHFGTSSPTTGAAANADSTPTVTVAEDGADLAYSPTVSNVATGLYKVQIDATAGNGFEAGRRYSVYVVATVGGVTGRDGIGEFEVLAVDLNTGVASVSGLNAANLDVAVSTRLAEASYTAPDNSSISTILGRVDVATSTRLASASYSAPPSAASIRSEIDANSTKLDVAVSTRLASGSYTAPDNATIAAIAGYVDTEVAAIKAKTDLITFTVSGQIDANVQYVNDVAVVGTGQTGNEWGPA